MSNSIWDWWFGDGPMQHATPGESATDRHAKLRRERHTLRRLLSWAGGIAVRRRTIVFLGVVSTSGVFLPGWTMAEDDLIQTPTQTVSFGWVPALSFTMIEADDVIEAGDVAEVAEDGSAFEPTEDQALDEDALRRQRLRDLLGEDAEMSFGGNDSDAAGQNEDGAQRINNDPDSVFSEPFIEDRLPDVESGRFVLPPLRAVSIDQKPIGNGRVPEALNAGDELPLVALPEDGYSRLALSNGGAWPQLIRPWAAPNTFSHPLYFEDRMLERHGHERWGCFQPLASGTRFFVTLPMLPYLATVQEPCDIVYSKGYYRAGSPVPKFYQRPPLERRAVIVEAAAVAGAFIAIP